MAEAEAALKKAKIESIKLKEYLSVKFRGDGHQNPEAHVLLFRKLCEELKYNAVGEVAEKFDEIKKLFFKTVTEKALIWYDSAVFVDFQDLTTQFLRHYSGSHGVSGDLSLFNSLCWKQGETAAEFKNRLQAIASRLELPATLVKHRFIHGLPDCVKPQLLPFYDQELGDLMSMAQNLLSLNQPSRILDGAGVNSAEASKGDTFNLSKLEAEVSALRREVGEVRQNQEVLATTTHESDVDYGGFYQEDFGYDSYPDDRMYDAYFSGPRRWFGGRRGYRGPGQRRSSFRGGRGFYPDRGFYPGRRFPPGRGFYQGRGYPSQNPSSVPFQSDFQFGGPSQISESRGGIVCKFCKRGGHDWSRCWDLRNKLDQDQDFQ